MRDASITRKTSETDITVSLAIEGSGKYDIKTGCGCLDHMLSLFAAHGRFDLQISCKGDTHIDYHHTVEDVGIVLGAAFSKALADMRAINRYADIVLPMDEALVLVALDISKRAYLNCDITLKAQKVGDFDCELVNEFLLAFSRSLGLTLHIKQLYGSNTHHIIEAIFKALGRALGHATAIDKRLNNEIPSTKGILG